MASQNEAETAISSPCCSSHDSTLSRLSPIRRLQLPVGREAAQAARGPEARAVQVADGLQRLADGQVRGRRRRGLLQREDQLRRLARLPFHRIEKDEVLVRLRVAREETDLLVERGLGLVSAAESRQGIAAIEVQLRHRLRLPARQLGGGAVDAVERAL